MDSMTNSDIATVTEPCVDCSQSALLKESFADWSEHDLLAAILAELVVLRGNITTMSDGLADIGSSGIMGMLGGLFGSKKDS